MKLNKLMNYGKVSVLLYPWGTLMLGEIWLQYKKMQYRLDQCLYKNPQLDKQDKISKDVTPSLDHSYTSRLLPYEYSE